MKWKIYYGDGSTIDSRGAIPCEVPGTNVQVIVQDGKLQSGKDAYYWNADIGWCGCDTAGMFDYLHFYVGHQKVIFGRSIRDEDYWEIRKKARAELEKS